MLLYANDTGVTQNELVFRIFPNAQNIYGGRLLVSKAMIDGIEVQPEVFLSDSSGLRLTLPQPLAPDSTAQIYLSFSLTVPTNFERPETYGIFNMTSDGPVLVLANWFPILATWGEGGWLASPVQQIGDAVTSQTSLFQVSISAPTDWKVVATGKQIGERNQTGAILHEYISGPTRDFMIVASPSFESRTQTSGEISINQWGLPKSKANWDFALETSRSALTWFGDIYGEYPFNELDIVAVPLQNASGVEYPGLILIKDDAYNPQDANQKAFLKIVILHEVAHQWWYSIIGNDVLLNPWQDEALATYSTLDFLEKNEPAIYQVVTRQYEDRVSNYEKDHPNESVGQPVSAFQGRGSAYSTIVYMKGALFLKEIRQKVGEKAFYEGLSTYYRQYKYRLAEPSQLLDAFQKSCNCDMKPLFQQWGVLNTTP